MFESARLTDDHTLEGLDCGKESLNTWLTAHARRADSNGVAHVCRVVRRASFSRMQAQQHSRVSTRRIL